MVRTYAEAGVNIDAKGAQVRALVDRLTFRRRGVGRPWGPKGHFAGFVDMGRYGLGMCTDSVGTKVFVANEMRRWDTVGVDCVAANVNDMVCAGAEPIAFVDYVAVDTQDPELPRQLGVGLDAGAREANVTIVGGELAVMPELLNGFDLVGACVGVVDKAKIIDGRGIRPGDRILGIPSSGFHCNGYTLIRRVLRDRAVTVMDPVPKDGRPWGEVLLEPTRIYVRPVLDAIRRGKVSGLANITGGGLRNLVRLRPRVEFRITDPLPVPPEFLAIQELAGIEDREMYETFNMGMGFAVIAPAKSVAKVLAPLKKLGARVVGEVARGAGVVLAERGLRFTASKV
ncbi:MAG: phosphoribosylformylglycinamidine cyclo-ligase [Methanobacteriota archaeon]|nr:MAG: phosphoribosylformylglycinamidine cyclo-ligase [Euryarchaeota archaeon]